MKAICCLLPLLTAALAFATACAPPTIAPVAAPSIDLAGLGCFAPVREGPAKAPPPAAAAPVPLVCEDLDGTPAVSTAVEERRLVCPAGTSAKRATSPQDVRWCERPDGVREGGELQCQGSNGLLAVASYGAYAEGKRVGAWLFYSGGLVTNEQRFVAGLLDGPAKSYHPNGSVASIAEYSANKLHGASSRWAANGTKTEEGQYEGGLAHGTFTRWADDGRLLGTWELSHGTGTVPFWCANGEVAGHEERVGGLLEGSYQTFHCNGRLQSSGRYEKNQRVGRWRDYDAEGRLLNDEGYRAGLREGEASQWWPERGARRWSRTYVAEKLQGPMKLYGDDGRLVAEGAFQAGTPSGTWTTYDRSGHKLEEIVFGPKSSRWTQWNPDGKQASLVAFEPNWAITTIDGQDVRSSCLSLGIGPGRGDGGAPLELSVYGNGCPAAKPRAQGAKAK